MIVWALVRWASEICTCPCENTRWRLSLWALRKTLWDSSCSWSLTQSLCLWASRITTMTPLINKNERDICDCIYPGKALIMERLHSWNVACSSLHRITWDDVSCFMEDTLQKIVEHLHMVLHRLTCDTFTNKSSVCLHHHGSSWSTATSSPTIRPSVYISIVHHDDIYVVSFDRIFVCGYVLSWCMCVCMCTHGGQSYFLYLEWKRFTTLSFWRVEKIWILRVGKIMNLSSFIRVRRRNFYFFFIRISVVVSINLSFPLLQTCASIVLLGSSPCCPLTLLVHLHFLSPEDRDEVNEREVCECDGWVCDLDPQVLRQYSK